jgi:hypothetical protein
MAKYLLTDGYVEILAPNSGGTPGTVDLSNHCFSLDVPLTREQVDVSGFSPTAAREFLPGVRDERMTIGMLQDFGRTLNHGLSLDETLNSLYSSGTQFPITVRPTSGTVSVTNPSYKGTVALFDWNPLAGQLNARGETNVTFIATTATGITRGTT